jgi:hypothetical protein
MVLVSRDFSVLYNLPEHPRRKIVSSDISKDPEDLKTSDKIYFLLI